MTPSGVISFSVGSISADVSVDSDGTAVFTTSALPVGTASVSAVYEGDSTHAGSTSPTLVQTVVPSAVSIQLAVQGTGFVYNRISKTFTTTLTLTNSGATTVSGPVQAVFSGLPSGVTVVSPTDTYNGDPYITVPGGLTSGQSVSLTVQFSDPSVETISYTLNLYSGVF